MLKSNFLSQVAIGAVFFSKMLFADADTVILQQGVNGYTGSQSAFMWSQYGTESVDSTFIDDTLKLNRHC